MIKRITPELTTEYTYNPDGLLQKNYTYSSGILSSVNYSTPSGSIATENYTYTNGHLTEIKLNGSNSIWKLTAENAFGQPTGASTGPLPRTYTYTDYGMPTGRTAGSIQSFGYNFDINKGNLTSRTDRIRNITETFSYDNLNRLTGFGGRNASYDEKGNILSITGVGTMEYNHLNKPYAVTGLTLSGTAVPACDQTVSYTSFQRPDIITENVSNTAKFTYNASGDRVKMVLTQGGTTQLTRYYIGNQYEQDVQSGTERLYLGGDAYSASAVYVKEGGNWNIYYICRDYLGSITHIIDGSGVLRYEYSSDAWGRLRNPATQEVYALGSEPSLFLGRGYTGHEHLPGFGLVNMNARLYDPALGRFLSPDPYVQAPDFSQNFNRYSYGMNNPLVYTDPDGEFIVGYTFGFLRGLLSGKNPFKEGYKTGVNELKIYGGLFASDPNKSTLSRIGELFSRFTWQLPQTILGFSSAYWTNNLTKVNWVKYKYGTTVLQTEKNGWGGITQSSYIIGDRDIEADANNPLFQHEYGHYIQSQKFGFFYYSKFGIPSALSKNSVNHSLHPVEQDANVRAFRYFSKHVGGLEWNRNYNPIIGYDWSKSYLDQRNQSALENGLLGFAWHDYLLAPMGNLFLGLYNACKFNQQY